MITAVIVDDEPGLGDGLKRMVESHYVDINVAAICYNVKEAEEAIIKFRPQLVFLDVELQNGNTSFDLLDKISPIDFQIIFTTAHNQYAIQAIKFSAIDYLLKPIDDEELKAAVEKFRNKRSKTDSNKIKSLLTAFTQPGNQQNKIHLTTKTGYELVTVADILYCQGMDNYTMLMLNNNRRIEVIMPLRQFEKLLAHYRFVRIHQSYLINLNHVKKYVKGKDGTAIVSNNATLTISRNYKEDFIQRLKTI